MCEYFVDAVCGVICYQTLVICPLYVIFEMEGCTLRWSVWQQPFNPLRMVTVAGIALLVGL